MKSSDFLKELRSLTKLDLQGKAAAIAEESMRLRFKSTVGQLEKSSRLGELRKNQARVQTVLKQLATKESK